MSEKRPKVREKSRERSGNLCSPGYLIVAVQQNNLPVLYSYGNSFFMRDVHREFALLNVHLFDILPTISSSKARESWGIFSAWRVVTLCLVV